MNSDPDNELVIRVSEVLAPVYGAEFGGLSPSEQVVVLVWSLEADVNNGGFNQYFFNSASSHCTAVPHALRAIGAPQAARLVERALAYFPDASPPAGRTVRQDLLEHIDPDGERFNSLDQAFFAYPDDLGRLLAQFIRANRDSIRGA